MAYQNISQTVSGDEIKKIKQAIESISTALPFLVALTTDEKKSLVKLGSKSVDFVKDCNNVAQNYPQILPSGFDAGELAKDSKLFEQLSELRLLLNTLNEKLNDTTTAVGNEAMKASLTVYEYVKTAAKSQAGLKTVSEQLQQRFKGQGKTKKTT
ncbi:hypothetical protein AD998_06030 [bacterium 336/3]|nr:hypothetical protein AD998_06030 [bacterium 336/3]